MLHPTSGKGAETRFLVGAVLSDGGTEEFFVCPNDAAFTKFAPGVITRGEYAGLAV